MYKIYKVTNLINNVAYIGQTKTKLQARINRHIYSMQHGSNLYFHNAIRKYGIDGFNIEVIAECESLVEANSI